MLAICAPLGFWVANVLVTVIALIVSANKRQPCRNRPEMSAPCAREIPHQSSYEISHNVIIATPLPSFEAARTLWLLAVHQGPPAPGESAGADQSA
jgi:hypothetical protein